MDYTGGSGGVPSDALYEIAVTESGSETFRAIPKTGVWPTARVLGTGLADPSRQRGLVYGGGAPNANPATWASVSDELWELDFGTPDPTFKPLGTGLAPGRLISASMVLDATGDAAFMIGGNYPLPTPQTSASVFRLDLTTDAFDAQVVATLPMGRNSMTVATDADGTGAFVFGGTTMSNAYVTTDVLRFDFAARTFAVVPTTQSLPATLGPAVMRRTDGRFTLASNAGVDAGFATLDVDAAGTVTPLAERGVNSPSDVEGASTITEEGPSGRPAVVFGSQRSAVPPTTQATAFAWENGTWTAAPTLAQAAFARHHALPVFVIGNGRSGLFGGRKYVGGVESSLLDGITPQGVPGVWTTPQSAPLTIPVGFPADIEEGVGWDACGGFRFYESNASSIWRRSGTTYERLDPSPVQPGSRVRAQFVGLSVGSSHRALIFSGLSGGSTLTDTWLIDACNALPIALPTEGFIAPVVSGTAPAGRVNGTLVALAPISGGLGSRALLFGGATSSAGTTFLAGVSLAELDASDGVTWTALPASAEAPPDRYQHVAFWDRAQQRMIIVGGVGLPSTMLGPGGGARKFTDTWEYRLPAGF